MRHRADVGLKLGGQIVPLPDTRDAVQIFARALGVLAAQLIAPGARMGVQIQKRFVLLFERLNDQALDGVFEDVGVVSGVEAVAITEHAGWVSKRRK